jgi:hypothetical protein
VRGVEVILALVVLATAVAASARRLRVPAPSLLVVAGVLVALVPGVPAVTVAPSIISLVVLPPCCTPLGSSEICAVHRPSPTSVANDADQTSRHTEASVSLR